MRHWGVPGWAPNRLPFGPLILSPGQWAILVLAPVAGVLASLRCYERRLRRGVTATAQSSQS
jgi:hypothetical protein